MYKIILAICIVFGALFFSCSNVEEDNIEHVLEDSHLWNNNGKAYEVVKVVDIEESGSFKFVLVKIEKDSIWKSSVVKAIAAKEKDVSVGDKVNLVSLQFTKDAYSVPPTTYLFLIE
jgi:hypothetical protein